MSFSFGFSGDDIEEDPNDVSHTAPSTADAAHDAPPPIPARTHDLDDLLSTLPDKISYSIFTTTSPKGLTVRLPRRELFDVRLQLMAEDDGTSSVPLAGLDTTDLQPNIYEGGYKTWECSTTLVHHLLDHGPRKALSDLHRVHHVLELGCGSALPSLLLFQYALRNGLSLYFTLADYNVDVLRLVTLPNLLLVWATTLDAARAGDLFGGDAAGLCAENDAMKEGEGGDVYLTPAVLTAFKAALSSTNTTLTLLSGSWTPTSALLPLIPSAPALNTLLLASETIYSPASLVAFTDAMVALMARVETGKALVAAKRVYFGVGGSVDAFKECCGERGCVVNEVGGGALGAGEAEGVRRVVCEVQMC